jgi:hypothetical protein
MGESHFEWTKRDQQRHDTQLDYHQDLEVERTSPVLKALLKNAHANARYKLGRLCRVLVVSMQSESRIGSGYSP